MKNREVVIVSPEYMPWLVNKLVSAGFSFRYASTIEDVHSNSQIALFTRRSEVTLPYLRKKLPQSLIVEINGYTNTANTIHALSEGADAYITSSEAALLPILMQNHLHRHNNKARSSRNVTPLSVNYETCVLQIGKKEVILTPQECLLAYVLIANRGMILPLRYLAHKLHASEMNAYKIICTLRKKLKPHHRYLSIRRVWGQGYGLFP